MKKQLLILGIVLASFAVSGMVWAGETEAQASYGYQGTYDEAAADNECLVIFEGTEILDGVMKNCHQETAVQNSEDSVLIINNSFVKDSVLPIVTMDTAKCYIIGSTVESTSGGAVFAGLAVEPEEGTLPLSTYFYGSKINALNTGSALYNELFCDSYIYGSLVTGSQVGVESETFGSITVGSLKDGEGQAEIAAVLSDLGVQNEEDAGSVIESGRNAIILNSSNNPDFTELDGMSEEALYAMSTQVSIRNAEVRTVKLSQSGMRFQAADTPYTDHCKGSVVLIKSTNADITIEDSLIESYKRGTGYIFQSVLGDDDEYIMSVADKEEAPGINISVASSELAGGISHEDYQRDMRVVLTDVSWTGSANEFTAEQWNAAAEEEGFEECIYDDSYETHHGLSIALKGASSWTVTEPGTISCFTMEDGCTVEGAVSVNGEAVELVPGEVYEGEILVAPAE